MLGMNYARRFLPCLAIAFALSSAVASPATAAQTEPSEPSPSKAGLYSGLAPIGVGVASALFWNLRLGGGISDHGAIYILALAPLGFGAGQLYAGQPARALAVGLGSYASLVGGLGVGLGTGYVASSALGWSATGYIATGVVLGALMPIGYGVWAIEDAAETARRVHRARPSGRTSSAL